MEVCRFYAQGRCAFGTACRLAHVGPSGAQSARRAGPPGRAPVTAEHPSGATAQRIDLEDGQRRTLAELRRHYSGRYSEAEIDAYWEQECVPVGADSTEVSVPTRAGRGELSSSDIDHTECGICFENIKSKGERFGMLESCDHAFCLNCIRSWRRERERQDRNNLRLCPVCRNESFFVIPSDKLVLEPEKKRGMIEKYKQEMSHIPCKLFDYGRGSCAFGSSCFYAHLNPDGTRHVPAPLRWVAGSQGNEVMGEVTLSDFFS